MKKRILIVVISAICSVNLWGCKDKTPGKQSQPAPTKTPAIPDKPDAPSEEELEQRAADYLDSICALSTLHSSCLRRMKLPVADVPPQRYSVEFVVLDVEGTDHNVTILEKEVGTLENLKLLDESVEKADEHTRSLLFRSQREGDPVRWIVAIAEQVPVKKLQALFNLLYAHGIEQIETLVRCANPPKPPPFPKGEEIKELLKLPLAGNKNSMVGRLSETCPAVGALMDEQNHMHPAERCNHLREKLPAILATDECKKDRDTVLAILQKVAIPSKITGFIPMTLTPKGPMKVSEEMTWGDFVKEAEKEKKGVISVKGKKKKK
jgi:hypothetical protein